MIRVIIDAINKIGNTNHLRWNKRSFNHGHTLNIPADTLEDEVEPFLLREGFIQRTPRGRMVTAKALAHLGISQKSRGKPSKSKLDSPDDQLELF